MTRLVLLAASLGLVLTVLFSAPVASAADVQCSNTAQNPLTGVVAGNVVVPSGANCLILGAAITGNVTAQVNARVAVTTASTIGGNLHCNNCGFADLTNSSVGGNVQISGEKAGSFIENSVIEGDLQIKNSHAISLFAVQGNIVGGNFTFNNNTGDAFIIGNTISGNFQCQNNVPPPSGAANTAKSKQGQCVAL